MPQEGFKRKLTAILSADVVGYSRLMDDNEEATVRTLNAYRDSMKALIQQHRGRVVDTTGDNLLAEFTSVVDALNCSVKIQLELTERNTELSSERRMAFRIGVNVGDVIEEKDRIYGDGVNIAARVEALAEAGGICITGRAYDQVKNKLEFGYQHLGEHSVKNIPEPVRVYKVLMEPEAAGKVLGEKRKTRRWLTLSAAIVLVIGIGGLAGWYLYLKQYKRIDPASLDRMAYTLPDKPSIAVLPFNNLSDDPEQEYFSDGITNDLIAALSRFGDLLVIASNTVFTYKGKAVNVKEVGHELGVRYVLEGSVQKAGDKVRINAQLIEATSGHHLWAEHYNRDLKDLFALQDEIVQILVAQLAVKISTTEQARAMRKDTANLEAYDYLQRGREYYRRITRSANRKARQLFENALELDPNYASAYVGLGWTYFQRVSYGWTEFADQSLQHALDLAHKALSLDESNASAHRLAGHVYTFRAQYNLAINEIQQAININPNDADSYRNIGWVLLWSGKIDEAIRNLEKSLRLDSSSVGNPLLHLGMAYYLKGRYQDAQSALERGVIQQPNFVGYHIALAATFAQLGRHADAKRSAEKVLQLNPFFEVENWGTAFRNQPDRAKIIEGLRKAGLN
jgi:adenylate cyclase